ncbi:nuclear pore complex assembly-domain-containing protein [Irpex rosettiformis]|uniref:Nuclear pore complex assembly-domain-containing protein n=1 Tax=Irpex rosettiformis TaxID=378272 RepID=A0ACB8TZC1_9APHY|nr:nuclear pore complex assembly-domain-containing protein [Irpex rosettiformis]
MDPEATEADFIQLFDLTPETFAWRAPIPRQIEQRRAAMTDLLIFDILLSSGGIKQPDALYPPHDESQLRDLLDAIEETTYDGLKKDCLVYFLLKWHKDGREERFQDERCIPPQFVVLADAYWFLDSGEDVPCAISLLSDARLNRDYTSKIIQTISLEKSNANALVLRYIRAAKPLLTEPDDIDAYSIALADSSLLEAWQYQRTFSEQDAIRTRIFRNILTWCLSPKAQAKPLTQLLSFPLSNFEQTLLHQFALHPPSNLPASSIPIIQDLACFRLIHSGQLAAAVKLDRQFAITSVRGTFGGKAAQERRQTIDEILSVMPASEKQLLELELEQTSQTADATAFLNGSITDLSMSWEHVRSPQSKGPSSSKPTPVKATDRAEPIILPIPERSGAPRFGGPIPSKPSQSSSFAAARNVFDTIAKSSSPQGRPLVQSDTAPLISSIEAPVIGQLSSKLITGSKGKEPVSLLDTRGSAQTARNAFFHPSPSPLGKKRKSPEDTAPVEPPLHPADISTTSAMDVSAILNEPADTDAEMHHSEDGDSEKVHVQEETKSEEDSAPEYTTSVFDSRLGRSLGNGNRTITKASSPEVLPGAFEPESEHDDVHDESAPGAMLLEELEAPPRPPPRRKTTPPPRRVRAPRLAKEASLTHSVPGAFIPDADEEADHVPPLPPPTPATRRQTRKVRTKAEEDVRKESAPRLTRRSSRLSVVSASSAGSPSPEPPSPERRTSARAKSTRLAASGSTSTRTPRSRKQR